MKKKKRFITASVTVLAAVATAHLMQRGSDDVTGMVAVGPVAAGVMPAPERSTANPTPETARNPVTVVTRPETVMAEPEVSISEPLVVAAETELPPTDASVERVSIAANENATGPVLASSSVEFPDMPLPPKDASMPEPLPVRGPDLQLRMAPAASDPVAPVETVAPSEKRSEFGLSCGVLLTASPKDAAMVGLIVTDPCRGGQVFTLEHGPLIFSATLNDLGTYMGDVPALDAEAVLTARFEDGETIQASAEVPLADRIDRVALFTDGQSGLAIHALEFGADYEQAGHVWSGNPRDADSAANAGGGFVTVLGDSTLPDAHVAEVYTFPANTRHREGVVRLSIEAEVTALNCGKDISGQSLQKEAGQVTKPVSLTLAMPDCDAIGEFLVLKNLLRDLKIASN